MLNLSAKTLDKVLSLERTQSTLENLDTIIWGKSPLISKANEIGASLEGGIDLGAKAGKWGLYGITGIGFITAYDTERKRFSFEIYQDFDLVKTALPFYIGAGAFVSLLASATYYDPKQALKAEKGHGFCTLGFAGCITEKNIRLGVSAGVAVGFPATSIFMNEVTRVPYFRIDFTGRFPFIKPKVIGADLLLGALKATVKTPIQLLKSCKSYFTKLRGKS